MKKLILITIGILLFPLFLLGWVGSSGEGGFNSPDAVGDNSIVYTPFTITGWGFNQSQGTDLYTIFLFPDTNADSVIDQTEWDNKVEITKYDYNFELYNATLSERYECDTDLVDGTGVEIGMFFLFYDALDLNGDACWSNDIIGLGPEGDGTRPDSCIALFEIKAPQ